MDSTDAKLLDELQKGLVMVDRPFAEIAERIGTSEHDVVSRTAKLSEDGVIRQISAIFDSASLGYTSALVAFAVRENRLDAVAESVAQLKSVSHCYSRSHRFNLWFTATAEPGKTPDAEVDPLVGLDGVEAHLMLPAANVFKVGVFFKMTPGEQKQPGPVSGSGERHALDLSDHDRRAVRVLQKNLEVVPEPFDAPAKEAGMTVDELLERGRWLMEQGAMRRFAAVLRHGQAGYSENAMICWRVAPEDMERAGQALASHRSVSHCYERVTYPEWTYNLYTMVHARSEEQLGRIIHELRELAGDIDYSVLHTTKEYKKSRVVYFT